MNALRDADEGELIVKLPADCINQVSESEAQSINKTTTFLNSQPGNYQFIGALSIDTYSLLN